jgi:uncharacterized circularly permuted ATP-grasp superfamily protein
MSSRLYDRVLEDDLRKPSGISYVLENRAAIRRHPADQQAQQQQ